MGKAEDFEKWYYGTFLCSRDPSSPILISENRTYQAKLIRILFVSKALLNNPKKNIQEIRREVATQFFVSMRCALDYINYSKGIIKEWENRKVYK